MPESSARTSPEHVILVDEDDKELGVEEKLRAHLDGGKLHRAFSVFICRPDGRLLLQRRSQQKYHFAGLWTNACCGHPRHGEDVALAARRRLQEELGFNASLEKAAEFLYRAFDLRSGYCEYEYDHVFRGIHVDDPQPDPLEVEEWKWVSPQTVKTDLKTHPQDYTPWFPIALGVLDAAGGFSPLLERCRSGRMSE